MPYDIRHRGGPYYDVGNHMVRHYGARLADCTCGLGDCVHKAVLFAALDAGTVERKPSPFAVDTSRIAPLWDSMTKEEQLAAYQCAIPRKRYLQPRDESWPR